jgi:hypothetical protein
VLQEARITFHVPVKATRSIWDDDDKHVAWDLEPVSSGMDTSLHPGGLNGQRDVRHPTIGQFLVYYNLDSVPPHPEPFIRVLVSGECAVDPYRIVVLVGRCKSPSSSRPAGVLDTFLHKPWLQCRSGYHKHQGSSTYHSIRATWCSFYLPFLADVLLPRDDCTVQQKDYYCTQSVDHCRLRYRKQLSSYFLCCTSRPMTLGPPTVWLMYLPHLTVM